MSNSRESGPLGAASMHIYTAHQQDIQKSDASASTTKVIEAQVVVRESKENPGQKEKGVVIEGKFYKVELPADLKEGDRVNLKVAQNPVTGKIDIAYLSKAADQQTSIANQENQKVTSELLKLLNKLNLTSQIISQLKEVTLKGFKANVTSDAGQLETRSMILLEKLGILTEKKLFDPALTLSALKNYDFKKLKSELQSSKESFSAKSEVSFEQKEKIENIRLNLKVLIKDLDALSKLVLKETEANTKGEAHLSPEKQLKITAALQKISLTQSKAEMAHFSDFEKALDKMNLDSLNLKSESKPVSRLMTLLRVVAERDVAAQDEGAEALVQLVKQQIAEIKNFEATIKKILVSPSSESQIQTLLRVIDNIDLEPLATDTPLQKEFKLMLIDLKKVLSEFSEGKLQPLELKLYLSNLLEKLYKDFGLEPLEKRILNEFHPPEFELLKPEQVKILKTIEAQIKLILNSPKDMVYDDLISMLKEFQDTAEPLAPGKETPIVFKQVAELIKKLESYKAGGLDPAKADKEITQTLKLFKELVGVELSKNILPEKDTQQAVLISSLIKSLVNSEELQSIENNPDQKILVKILSNPSFKALMEILKRVDQGLPAPENRVEHELVEFAGELLENIERDLKSPPQKLNETFKRALDRFDLKFNSNSDKNFDLNNLSGLSATAFKSLEAMVSGQEILQKLNPLMLKSGEPIILLFPFFINGMLSKLELSLSKKKVDEEEENNKKKKQRDSKRKAFNEHLSFEINLPNIGLVLVNLVHTGDGVFVKFNLSDSKMSEKIKPYLQALQSSLKEKGFENLYFSVVSEDTQQDWFADSLKKIC